MFNNIYKAKKVFLTGNTGFKGSWIALWLLELGAEIVGYSLDIPTNPSHHKILNLNFETIYGDIRDKGKLCGAIASFQPDIVLHMAAQSLVRKSYGYPVETFETNVLGTVNLFDACRQGDFVKAIVIITSDKCYENRGWGRGYHEGDPMGGYDTYSASKGCAELVTASYRRSFFSLDEYQKTHRTLVASARAGNSIGGGDWGEDRLIPDIMRAAAQNKKSVIRNPHATRPWQHVLEPLSGYLLLGQRLLEGKREYSGAWNFGPDVEGNRNVLSVVKQLQNYWGRIDYKILTNKRNLHEANLLKLNSSKARTKLGWKPVWNSHKAFVNTAKWYRKFYESGCLVSKEQLAEYTKAANQKQLLWAIQRKYCLPQKVA